MARVCQRCGGVIGMGWEEHQTHVCPTPSGTDAADAAAAGAGGDLLRRLAEDASFLESKGFIISSIREARARIRELEAERQRLIEGFQLIEVDLEAGDLPPRIRVPLALRRTKAWIKVAQRAAAEGGVAPDPVTES